MQWKIDTGGGSFQQPPIGTHLAICIKLIDIGTQRANTKGQATYFRSSSDGNSKRTDDRGRERREALHRPKFYTASLSEKANLRKDLANWRGRTSRPRNWRIRRQETSSASVHVVPDDEREGKGSRDWRHGGSQGYG